MELFKLLGTIAIETEDANDAIDETTENAEESSNKMASAFKKIGGAVATFLAVDKIKDFGLACVNAAADANAMNSQFTQVFGDFESDASDSLSSIAEQAGIVENRMKGSFTKIASFAKTTGMDTEDALELSERAMIAVADSAAFYDRSLEETTESLQSFLKGNYENDSALGLSCTETTRNAAANKLYGKSFNELSEAQKQLTLLQMVEDANAASGALGQAARESDTWTNQTGNLQQAWNDFEAIIGATFLPSLINLVSGLAEKIQGASEKLIAFKQWCAENETIVKILGGVIATITAAIITYNIALNASTIATTIATTATSAFGAVLGFVTSPITLVVAAIGILVAAGVALYKNWDVVSAKCAELWKNVVARFTALKTGVAAIFQALVTAVKTPINSIIGFMNGLTSGVVSGINTVINALNRLQIDVPDWVTDLTGLTTFGFNIKTLTAPQIPLLEKGGILEKGQVGLLEGKGAEAVVPLDRNSAWISRVADDMRSHGIGDSEIMDKIYERLNEMYALLSFNIPQMARMQVCLDTGALIGELAPGMDEALGELAQMDDRGV